MAYNLHFKTFFNTEEFYHWFKEQDEKGDTKGIVVAIWEHQTMGNDFNQLKVVYYD